MIVDNNPMMMYTEMDKTCVPQETMINNVELANAYVPFEKMCGTFSPLSALKKGTAFPPLYAVSGWEPGVRRMNYE